MRRAARRPTTPLDRSAGLEETGLLAYTSGTTGAAKGVMLSHANLTWNVVNVLSCTDLRMEDVMLALAPLSRLGALGVTVLPTLFKGGTIVLAAAFDPVEALDLIQRQRVTVLFGGPDQYAALLAAPGATAVALSSLRVILPKAVLRHSR